MVRYASWAASSRTRATPARAADLAALFPDARLAVAPDSGHSPWVTDPAFFHTTVSAFLR